MATLNYPADLKYSRDHEWVAETQDDAVVRVGISDFAQDSLGDVVFVDLPEVGDTVTADETCGEVESTKSVSDVISPVSGEIVTVNDDIVDGPDSINSDPYGAGWLFEVRLNDSAELDALMDAESYKREVESEGA
ncbi:glycine cleavage system protein GcvH [Brevibacterium daeguense]|uniref:Glycine cleavage system H protein n=1 Tax=Brevibacterium daeguense TaxID=909936 RepID=A0ABP8EMT4_9MICO|nr:glycine cleavage system protein GcvH [Brevibacterium daeguense]